MPSLVGSEMCIRDRPTIDPKKTLFPRVCTPHLALITIFPRVAVVHCSTLVFCKTTQIRAAAVALSLARQRTLPISQQVFLTQIYLRSIFLDGGTFFLFVIVSTTLSLVRFGKYWWLRVCVSCVAFCVPRLLLLILSVSVYMGAPCPPTRSLWRARGDETVAIKNSVSPA